MTIAIITINGNASSNPKIAARKSIKRFIEAPTYSSVIEGVLIVLKKNDYNMITYDE